MDQGEYGEHQPRRAVRLLWWIVGGAFVGALPALVFVGCSHLDELSQPPSQPVPGSPGPELAYALARFFAWSVAAVGAVFGGVVGSMFGLIPDRSGPNSATARLRRGAFGALIGAAPGAVAALYLWFLPSSIPRGPTDFGLPAYMFHASLILILGGLFGGSLGAQRRDEPARHFVRRCARCGYSLRGLPDRRCPECGTPFDGGTSTV